MFEVPDKKLPCSVRYFKELLSFFIYFLGAVIKIIGASDAS